MDRQSFQAIGDAKRPLAKFCSLCQNFFSHWPEIVADTAPEVGWKLAFVHHDSIDALTEAANGSCDFCAQFLKAEASIGNFKWTNTLQYETEQMGGHGVGQPDLFDALPSSTLEVSRDLGHTEAAESPPISPAIGRPMAFIGLNPDGIIKYYGPQSQLPESVPGFVSCTSGQYMSLHGYDNLDPFYNISLVLPFPKGRYGDEFDEISERERLYLQLVVGVLRTREQSVQYDGPRNLMSTKDALPVARSWLDRCQQFHGTCKRESEHMLPTRLLQLDDEDIKLCLSDDIGGAHPYATLSHCWGGLPFQSLTKNTISAFRDRIPPEALTKTFRDAILVARSLGFRYLWIDSLCIVQDDADDWVKEASLMASVYSGSEVNIAASCAINGTVGCFFERDRSWKCQIGLDIGGEQQFYECYQLTMQHALEQTILSQRGWVVQERFLPCRTLHFTEEQLFWTCDEDSYSEIFPWGLPLSLEGYWCSPTQGGISKTNWASMVKQFYSANLTHVSDKLVAISGLARHTQKRTSDEYIVGMWRSTLVSDLCWKVDPPATSIVPCIAPSWSWASLDGPGGSIFCCDSPDLLVHLDSWVQILEIKMSHSTADPFGAVSEAMLRLRCTFFSRARITYYDHDLRGSLPIDHYMERMTVSGDTFRVTASLDTEQLWDVLPLDVYVVFCIAEKQYSSGLILAKTGRKPREYRRIGTFSRPAETIGSLEEFRHLTCANDSAECEEVIIDSYKHYIIELV